jgi:hypothetical protein
MKKIRIYLLLIFIIIVAVIVYTRNTQSKEYNIEEFLKLTDNETDKSTLITKYISEEELQKVQAKSIDIKYIWNTMGIQCLRKNRGYYYSIHKTSESEYVYILYKKDTQKNEIIVEETMRYNKILNSYSFSNLEVGKDTFQDVCIIDKHSSMFILSFGGKSFHDLPNKKTLIITYTGPNSTVSNMEYTENLNIVLDYVYDKDFV